MGWKIKGKKFISLAALCLVMLFFGRMEVYADEISDDLTNEVKEENESRFSKGSPWLENADDSIYSNSVDTMEDEQEIEPDDPGSVEKYLSEFIRNAASSLIALLEENLGAGFDRIIYGRVGSGRPNSVNIYGFELRSGNPYGVTASVCYGLIRSMAFVFLGISFVFLLAKSAWTGQTAQSREQIKSGFYTTAMKFSMLTLMPYLFDVALYVRDVALFGIKEMTSQMITGGATLSLSNAFLVNAERTGRFVDALMYLGTVLLTLYFAFIYVAIAIDLLICFVSFPVMCMLHTPKKDLLGGWMMGVFSDILTPVLDAVLLLVPLLTSLMLSDVIKGIAIIQMMMCMLIIPSRNRIKILLGIQNNEKGGLLGVMALATLGRAVARKAKGAVGHLSEIHSDMQKSRMHKGLADVDEEEQEALLSGYDQNTGTSGKPLENNIGTASAERSQTSEEPDPSYIKEAGKGTFDDDYEDETIDDHSEKAHAVSDERGDSAGVQEGYKGNSTQERIEPEGNIEEPGRNHTTVETISENGEQDETSYTEGGAEQETQTEPLTRNEVLRRLDYAMEQKQDVIDGLRAQKTKYQKQEKQKARQMLDHERGSEEYRELEKQRADAAIQVASTEQRIAGQMQDMNQLKNQAKAVRGSQTGTIPDAFDEKRAEIICKRANINNFEQPEFRSHLSNAQMQKLYQKRAVSNAVKGTAAIAGAAAGAMTLGGAGIFMQPSTVAMATTAGALGGSALGSGAAGIGMAGAQALEPIAGRTARTVIKHGKTIYTAGRQVPLAAAAASVDPGIVYSTPPMSVDPGIVYSTPSAVSEPLEEPSRQTTQEVKMEKTEKILQETVIEQQAATRQQIMAEVEKDSAEALKKVITPSGGFQSNAAFLALERANVETEKYLAAARETQGIRLTQKQERAKRIELQTEYMTEEVLKKLSYQTDYEKGSEKYDSAREIIQEKIRAIVEKQNKNIF